MTDLNRHFHIDRLRGFVNTVTKIRHANTSVMRTFAFVNINWNFVIVLDQFVMLLPWFVISQLYRKTNFFNPIDELIWSFDKVIFSVWGILLS